MTTGVVQRDERTTRPRTRVSPGLVRADALRIPLADESVDLIMTSPPYFALRSYKDHGVPYAGQIGSEETPQAFLGALWAVTAECWRVLKPSGVLAVNLGDRRSGSGNGPPGASAVIADRGRLGRGSDRFDRAASFGRPRSRMLLPHRFAMGCEDGFADPDGKGWIVLQDLVWAKLNPLPESVADRCRDSHEYIFLLAKGPGFFAAVDEVREPYVAKANGSVFGGAKAVGTDDLATSSARRQGHNTHDRLNPLGKIPGSVWSISSEPLVVPDEARERLNLTDHFAAFPTEVARRLILGWSPRGICVKCAAPRRPVADRSLESTGHTNRRTGEAKRDRDGAKDSDRGFNAAGRTVGRAVVTITGYACGCKDASAPTRPAVVLDPFVGTGTTVLVANALGRLGVGLDLSADYLRLARWRVAESGHHHKAVVRTWNEHHVEERLF